MSFSKSIRLALSLALFLAFALTLVACGDWSDDLFPTHADKRDSIRVDETGSLAGQKAPDFSTVNSMADSITLAKELASPGTQAVVLYFSMWCPICNSHIDHMMQNVIPVFPRTKIFIIDYVSGSVHEVRSNVMANGYAQAPFSVLTDLDNSILDAYAATMGTTVVLDPSGIIRMNEDYKDGTKLRQILEDLP